MRTAPSLRDLFSEKKADISPEKGLDDLMGFGKYKDLKIREVAQGDSDYMQWAMENCDRLKLNSEARLYCYEQQTNNRRNRNDDHGDTTWDLPF